MQKILKININDIVGMVMSEGKKSFSFETNLGKKEKEAIYSISGARPIIERVPSEKDPTIATTECLIEVKIDSQDFNDDAPIEVKVLSVDKE